MAYEHNQTEQRVLRCPKCQKDFEAKVWVVVDLDTPQVMDLLYRGELHSLTCPACGDKRSWSFSFLVFMPLPEEEKFWFVPAALATTDQKAADMQHLTQYVEQFHRATGREGPIVLHVTTPAQLHKNLEIAMDARENVRDSFAGVQETLNTVIQGDPNGYLKQHPELLDQAAKALDQTIAEAEAEGDRSETIQAFKRMRDILRNHQGK
jgi:hypothetical protein